jgi:phosphoribosylglycinamide formyltransferase-1
LPARIALVVSNRDDADGLVHARELGLTTRVMPHGEYASRDAYDRALVGVIREHGVKVAGATVHFVTPELDAGPIVMQAAVPVTDDDTAETVAARILAEEHRIYPEAIRRLLTEPWHLDGRRVVFGKPAASLR